MIDQAYKGLTIPWPSAAKIGITLVFLAGALLTWRPWCTLLCPLGAIYGLLNHASLFSVRFDPEGCTECDLCRKLCNYRSSSKRRAGVSRCVRCLDCVDCQAITVSLWPTEKKNGDRETPAYQPAAGT